MKRSEHKSEIIKKLSESNELYQLVPRTIDSIIDEVNDYLDEHFVRSDDPDKMLRHREKKHHSQAVGILAEKLSRKYGDIYYQTIRQIAEQHIMDDMGYVPDQKEYADKDFWKKWKESQNRK